MTGRQFAGLFAVLATAVVSSYVLAPGLAVVVLVAGVFVIAVVDHRRVESRGAEHDRRERLKDAALRANGGGGWRH